MTVIADPLAVDAPEAPRRRGPRSPVRPVFGVPLACAALAVLVPAVGGHGPFTQPSVNTLTYGVLAGLLALSLNMITGYAGPVSLGHAAFLGIGAFTTGLVVTKLGLPSGAGFVVAAVASTAAGATAALLVGLPALRLRGIYLALSTFTFADAVDHYFFNVQQLTGLGSGISVARPHLFGVSLHTSSAYAPVPLLALGAVWLFDVRLRSTRLGRALLAVRENEEVAASFGVHVARAKLLVFLFSGAVAGLAGALFAYQVTVVNRNSFTLDQSLFYLVIVVVGGLGSRGGTVAAAVLFVALPRWLGFLQGWELIVAPALLIFTLARHPGGFPGMIADARDRRALKLGDDELDALVPSLALPSAERLAARALRVEPAGRSARGASLTVDEVTVRFGGLTAVDGAAIEVPAGRAVGLVGPNGAGKSTLFNVVSGFVRPQHGTVVLDGVDITARATHERAELGMGRTFQQVGLVKHATLLENLLLAQHVRLPGDLACMSGLGAARAAEAGAVEEAHDLLRRIGLHSYAGVRVGALSTGQQRLVELSCAVASRPRLLLLDEPSAGLSPAASEHLAEQLRQLRGAYATSLLLIEHHLPLVSAVCESCYVLDAGRILAAGTCAEVFARPEVVAAYLGESAAATP